MEAGEDSRGGTEREDAEMEAVVLRELIALHPAQLTVEELILDIADPEDFAERDAVLRAVRDLSRAGLVHRNGDFALPSRAALRFATLLDC